MKNLLSTAKICKIALKFADNSKLCKTLEDRKMWNETKKINPLRGGGAEAPGFLLRVDERRGIGKLLQTWYFLGMAGPVANHISLQK